MAWKRIPWAPRYWVSSVGEVFSERAGRDLAQVDSGEGYLFVKIVDRTGKRQSPKVHRLVASVHLAPFPPRTVHMEVDHKNDDVRDNRASNLRWATRSQNRRATSRPTLPDSVVRYVREQSAAGRTGYSIARELGIRGALVSKWLNGKSRARAGGPVRQRAR